jgi:SAM-dependent methyltransferase
MTRDDDDPRFDRHDQPAHDHHQAKYTFGDSDTAATRLRLLAAIYEPSSAGLLRLCGGFSARHAVDLGCGLGWSTRLVHALLGPITTLGIDSSSAHIARAGEVVPPGIEFRLHDVTGLVTLGSRPDFLYSRFLLTHLREPERVIAGWAEAAADEAALVIEETDTIESDHPVFARYYALVDDLQRHYGQRLRVGAELVAAPVGSGWRTELSTVRRLLLPARQMARLHHLNLLTWRQDPHARATFDDDELDQLAARLAAVASGDEDAPPVRSAMRQLVMTKA